MGSRSSGAWWVRGDLNGFFGLFSNVLTNVLAATGLLLAIRMPAEIVFGDIVPGTAIMVGLGGIFLAYIAKKLSLQTGNPNVTALPYGLAVGHMFIVTFGVIGVVYATTTDWTLAWATGVAWNLVQGLIQTVAAFFGPTIAKYLPRAAMLGALAGVAIMHVSLIPLGRTFEVPYIGLTSFGILMVGWLALKPMPFGVPAGALAILVGTALAWFTGFMDLAPLQTALGNASLAFPSLALGMIPAGFAQLARFLPAAIPLAIVASAQNMNNLESAAAAGEKFNVRQVMLVPGLLTTLGACLGSPFPTLIYIGHPGWKATGARIGYSWLTGVAILLLGLGGAMPVILTVIPLVALLPILVYIGMIIVTQAFSVTEKKHMPAVALALMPVLIGFVVLRIRGALTAVGATVDYAALARQGIPFLGWERVSGGDVLVAMMLCAIMVFIIDRKFASAAIYTMISAVLSFFGFMHATAIGWARGADVALGYAIVALIFWGAHYYKNGENKPSAT